jgi:hypothetical protein
MPIGRVSLPLGTSGGGEADFTASVTTIEPSDTVTFTDQTTDITPTSWEWDFGDGEKSTLQNPSHRYKFSGQFTVTLIASDGVDTVFKQEVAYINCSSTDYIITIDTRRLLDPLKNVASQTGDDTFRFHFNVNSSQTGDIDIDWGDGTQQTVARNGIFAVEHTYTTPGIYKVKMLATSTNNFAPVIWPQPSANDMRVKILEFNNWGSGIAYNAGTGFSPQFRDLGCIFYANDKPQNASSLGLVQVFRETRFDITPEQKYLDHLFENFDPLTVPSVDLCFRVTSGFNENLDKLTLSISSPRIALRETFLNCERFNQPLAHWNTANNTSFNQTFSNARIFNQDISGWDTSDGTDFTGTFLGASSFNQDISSWDVSNSTTFVSMFRDARAFNQNLGAWPLRIAGTNMAQIFRNSGMSTENYTDTIVGWANYVFDNSGPINVNMTLQTGRTFTNSRPGGANFADAGAARTYLVGQGWSITGDTVV